MAIASNPVPATGIGVTRATWVDAQTVTSTDQTAALPSVDRWSQATLYVKVTAASGTSPTLDLKLQKLLPDTATWQDIAAFTQFTGTANRVMHLVSGGNKEEAQASGSLTAGTINSVPFGSTWRLNAVVAGTSPSFTFSAYLEGLV